MSYQSLFKFTLTSDQLNLLRKRCDELDTTSKLLVGQYGGSLVHYNVVKFRKEEEFTWFLLNLS